MLRLSHLLLPRPLHRLLLRFAHALRIRWWRLRKPLVTGCSVLALNPEGQILLIRHSYGSPAWMLPGGGIARGEEPIAAAIRELAEETGCRLDSPVEIAVTRRQWHGATNVVHVIAGRTADTPQADGREITAASFFALTALPRNISARLSRNLREWRKVI